MYQAQINAIGQLLLPVENRCTGVNAQDANRKSVLSLEDKACRWCLLGATIKVCDSYDMSAPLTSGGTLGELLDTIECIFTGAGGSRRLTGVWDSLSESEQTELCQAMIDYRDPEVSP